MASTKSRIPSKTSNQTGLQKMYIFNEPAFRKVQHEIDNEKYLSELDQELKKVLYDRKSPRYKKWLQYRQLLSQYFNFRNFMNESKTNDDEISIKQLQLEQRIQELENQLKTTQSSTESIKPLAHELMEVDGVAEISNAEYVAPTEAVIGIPSTKDTTPTKGFSLNKTNIGTNKGTKRKSTTPNQSTPRTDPRRRLDFGQSNFVQLDDSNFFYDADMAPAGEEEIIGISSDESAETTPVEHMDVSHAVNNKTHMETSAELLRVFDNELIGKHTIKQRLDAAPESVRRKFLINNEYPKRIFNITYTNERQEDEQMTINGLNVSILKGDTLKIVDYNGVTKVYNIREDSLDKIRNFLIEFHKKLDQEVDEYQKSRGEYISTRKYSIRDDEHDKNMKIVRFKNSAVKIPFEILEDVIALIDYLTADNVTEPRKYNNDAMEKAFKEGVERLKKCSKVALLYHS